MKTYTFKEQLSNRGCYAEILFDVSFDEREINNLRIEYSADPQWELACKAGVSFFSDYLWRKKAGHLEVAIYQIKYLPVDTSNLIVCFATVKALADVLSLHINGLQLETNSEVFCFPEVRSVP